MAIKIDCPRCKKALSIPEKTAGSYVHCPGCGGRFWVPKQASGVSAEPATTPAAGSAAPVAPSGEIAGASGGPPSGPVPPPQAPPVQRAPWAAPPSSVLPSAGREDTPASGPARVPPSGVTPPPPPPPKSGRKVARFVSTEAARSPLRMAADGKLPELQLSEEGEKKQADEPTGTTVNPLVLVGILSISVVFSISLALMDFGPEDVSNTRRKQDARKAIQDDYFDSLPGSHEPLQPYQELLRDAQLAHSAGRYQKERDLYQEVLDLLRTERGETDKGITGSPDRDKELERLISILLGGR